MKREKKEKVKAVKPEKVKKKMRFSIQWKMVLLGLGVVAAFMGLLLGYFLPGMQSALLNDQKTKTKENVQIAWNIIAGAYLQEKTGNLTEFDAQSINRQLMINVSLRFRCIFIFCSPVSFAYWKYTP